MAPPSCEYKLCRSMFVCYLPLGTLTAETMSFDYRFLNIAQVCPQQSGTRARLLAYGLASSLPQVIQCVQLLAQKTENKK